MREGRELYSEKYEKAMEMHKQGMSVNEIAEKLGISYSAAYHWIKGLRKPEKGNLNDFEEFLKENGPTNAEDLKRKFPKHNEIFLTAKKRGGQVFRYVMKKARTFGDDATWYFLKGQEDELNERIKKLIKEWKLRKMKEVMGEGQN